MGADYRAKAVIGLEIRVQDLYSGKKKVKAFDHDFDESVNFDPKSGRQLWREESQPIPEFDEDECEVCGYAVMSSGSECGYMRIIALAAATNTHSNCGNDHDMSPLPTDKQTAKFIESMKQVGLWDENKFGLHTILYCTV